MKPNLQTGNYIAGTAVNTRKMAIDAASTAHIIGLLTDLYSDPMLAVIREYSTNAWDSHVEAGNPAPIQITTPNRSEPFFKVRDFGIGMSHDDIFEIYSLYGASTKRESNDATGMLGLGCKSGLTYAVQFTVDAVKDGMRTVAIIGKGEDGVGEINILSHNATVEPNGVTVIVPVNSFDVNSFSNRIEEFFFYWRDGVLVDGEVPENIDTSEDWTQIDPDVYIRSSGYGTNRIVQGNVAYPFEKHYTDQNEIVAFVPIGLVDFTPSREDLYLNDRTNEVIQETKLFVERATIQSFRDELEECVTDWDRLCLYKKWQNIMPRTNSGPSAIVWRDASRFNNWSTWEHGWKVDVYTSGWNHTNKSDPYTVKRSKIKSFPSDEATPRQKDEAFFVKDFEPKTFTNKHYERLLAAGLITTDTSRFYVIPPAYSEKVATRHFPGVKWGDVPQLPKKPRAKSKGAGPRPTTKYMVYKGGTTSGCMTERDTFTKKDEKDTLWHAVDNRPRALEGDYQLRMVLNNTDKAVVLLTQRQAEKFQRKNPNMKNVEQWYREERQELQDLLTDEIRSIYKRPDWVVNFTKKWGPHSEEITNEHFLSIFDTRSVPEDLHRRLNLMSMVPMRLYEDRDKGFREHKGMMHETYPLVAGVDFARYSTTDRLTAVEHAIKYINENVPDWFVTEDEADETTTDQ